MMLALKNLLYELQKSQKEGVGLIWDAVQEGVLQFTQPSHPTELN